MGVICKPCPSCEPFLVDKYGTLIAARYSLAEKAALLRDEFEIWHKPDGIEDDGSGNVTFWRNGGIGGSQYDLTAFGNVTKETYAGRTVVKTDGQTGTYLQTASAVATAQPVTVFFVAKMDTIDPGATSNYHWDGHPSSGATRCFVRAVLASYQAWAGILVVQDITYKSPSDTNLNVHALVFDGASSSGKFNDEAATALSPGTNQFSALTIGNHNSGGDVTLIGTDGKFGEFAMAPRAFTEEEINLVSAVMAHEWNL